MNRRARKMFGRLCAEQLTHAERDSVRSALHRIMQEYPIATERANVHLEKRFSWSFMFAKQAIAAFLVTLIVIAGAGTSIAAERALPGDWLYRFKTTVNEGIRGQFTASPTSKAAWHVELAKRRLIEAERLAIHGGLTTTASEQLSTAIETHTRRASAIAAELTESGEYENAAHIHCDLETALSGHTSLLLSLGNLKTAEHEISNIALNIAGKTKTASEARLKATEQIMSGEKAPLKLAARNHLDITVKKIAEAKRLLEKSRSKLSSSVIVQADARLVAASDAEVQAEKNFAEENYRDSFSLAQHAFRLAEEANIFLLTAPKLRIELTFEPEATATSSEDGLGLTNAAESYASDLLQRAEDLKMRLNKNAEELKLKMEAELDENTKNNANENTSSSTLNITAETHAQVSDGSAQSIVNVNINANQVIKVEL